jgi:putative transposase
MNNHPQKFFRKTTRLREYDYSIPGAYFITLVASQRKCIFGNVIEGQMQLNRYGHLIEAAWMDLPSHYPQVNLGTFIVMPNHVHGIVLINEVDHLTRSGGAEIRNSSKMDIALYGLSEIVRALKSYSARRINELRKMHGNPVWQRSYYDRIIRNEAELHDIMQYILSNPMNWQEDLLRIDA